HSDLLYTVQHRSKRTVFLYLLVEHQSTPKLLLAFHLLGYQMEIWRRWLAEHPGARKLPAIVSVVIYHGRAGVRVGRNFNALIDLPKQTLREIRRHIPSFRPIVDHLTATPDDEILHSQVVPALVTLMRLCLKHGRERGSLLAHLDRWAD